MTQPTNYVRDALLTMDSTARRALRNVARSRVNSDPDEDEAMTPIWYAVYCQVIDLEAEEATLLQQLERDR